MPISAELGCAMTTDSTINERSVNNHSAAKPVKEQQNRRELLMRTAEELFAIKGIDTVSLNEINKAAGQRNTSALHYHFGNKKGLIDAIVYDHYAAIDHDINTRLDVFDALEPADQTPRKLLECLVIPFSNQLDSPAGINYLLIVNQVFMKSSEMILKGHPDGVDRARPRAFSLFRLMMASLPSEIRASRHVIHANMIFNALATYAQTRREDKAHALGSKDLFVSNLLDNLVSAMQAAPSAETLAVIDKEKQ
ncbi:TetR/AcrR family transcriptional regulator [uncultured Paraglaciecola sp.]|uniref:TetR/AcrR family transcriptional regulator n=1 Tax=uncultured Paraglaciecola sp. TaxID=1765024 RepID=UPI002620DBA3|nr:TetR/AcrR family transcriptional regulator [uncultured Paraglaciecola sp.]